MRRYILIILTLIAVVVWSAVFSYSSDVQIIACDVGQGDAILIQHKNDQILIDGGPNNKVLDCLGSYMPFWDHNLELVVNTHPDKDHAEGLVDVFDRYDVDAFLVNDLSKPVFSSQLATALQSKVGGSTKVIHPTVNNRHLRLSLIYLDILHPDEGFQDSKVNNYSIVTLLKYGEFKALFTGDIEDKVSDKVASEWSMVSIDYIKIPHHGSKNGISENLLRVAEPEIAVISVGKNSYGHPHKEVTDLLEKYGLKIFRTDQLGDVVIKTDGNKYYLR